MLLAALYFGIATTIGFSVFTILAILIMIIQNQKPEEIVNIVRPSAFLAIGSALVTLCLLSCW